MIHRIIQDKTANIHYLFHKNELSDELVIFLHGAFADHTSFKGQEEAFTPRYNVIFIDLLGHGLSNVCTVKDRIDATPEQLKRIMEVEKFDRAHIVGVSLGALLAQYFALKYPALVSSVVATGGYDINNRNEEAGRAQKESVKKCLWLALTSMDKFRRFAAGQAVHRPENKELYYRMAQGFVRKSFIGMTGLRKVVCERKDVSCSYPLLLLCGELDTDLAKNASLQWHRSAPGSRYCLIPGAGHTANMDNPEAFNETVLGFLSRTPRPPRTPRR
ncbi:MAG: alpha/beta fold hydrolase [Tannerellaceae bacterium]|jgi:pimeloyl-ACP methyl ester carboxylesterase|nr:alpha/beta fold hydrolase [Tannerellaceae bacterium]